MKVNFLLGSLIFRKKRTGVHLYYYNLLKHYAKDYDDFIVSVYNKKINVNTLVDKCFQNNVKYSHKFVRLLMYFIPAELFWGRADIYVCDGISPITLFKSKRVFVIHDLMVYLYPENYSFIKKLYLKYFFSKVDKADRIIAVSKQTKNDLVNILNVDENKVNIVYNGVEKIPIHDEAINLKVDINKKYLFYIGDFRKHKNVLSAIKAYKRYISKNNDELFFYIAGNQNGREYDALMTYVKDNALLNKVVFLGYVTESEKVYLYKHAFAFMFVSLYEGFGVPIIESMLYETPVITSNCSSMAEIAVDNSAILVDPNNIEEIAMAIESLNDGSIRKQIIEAGKNIAMQYSWDNAYKKFRYVLSSIGEINE